MVLLSPLALLALHLAGQLSGMLPEQIDTQSSVGVSAEYDSNAERLAFEKGQPKPRVVDDGLMRSDVNTRVTAYGPNMTLQAGAALGLKLFTQHSGARLLVGQGDGSVGVGLPWGLSAQLSTFLKGRGQLNGVRSYALERTDLVVSKRMWSHLAVQVGSYGSVYVPGGVPQFISGETGVSVGLQSSLTAFESLQMTTWAGVQSYPFVGPAGGHAAEAVRRFDLPLRAALGFVSRRRIFVSAQYTLSQNRSNSVGEAYTRHRLSALLGTTLPGALTVTLAATAQLSFYQAGISEAQQVILDNDDESQSSVRLQFNRPLFGGLTAVARFAYYGSELASGGLNFSRTTASLGLRADL